MNILAAGRAAAAKLLKSKTTKNRDCHHENCTSKLIHSCRCKVGEEGAPSKPSISSEQC